MIDFDAGFENSKAPSIGAMNLVLIALVLSILGVVCLVPKVYVGCAIFGAAGLVLGGYAMGYVHRHTDDEKMQKKLFVLSGAALLMSVVGFMFGFLGIAGSL